MTIRTKNVKIADYEIELEFYYGIIECFLEDFVIQSGSTKQSFKTTNNEIDKEIMLSTEKDVRRKYAEHSLLSRKIADWIPNYDGLFLHSVIIDIDKKGVAFSALSGTGKSTHLANWYAYLNGTKEMPECLKKLLKDANCCLNANNKTSGNLTIVNGDKPIVRFFDEEFCKEHNFSVPENTIYGVPYAYGTPWSGKEHLGCNMRTPLKHICFIERSETNYVTKIDKKDAIDRIMKQVYMPKDPIALMNTLKLVDRLINSCELWIIHCNMDIESAEVAYRAIFGE